MMWLWGQFTKFYGGKAQRNLGVIDGDTFQIWFDTLKNVSYENIKLGLRATVMRKDPWPPELQEFIYICVQNRPVRAHRPRMALVEKASTKEYAAEYRQKLKEILC